MVKITELKEIRLRTVYNRNADGELERDAEEWIFSRPVKTVSPGRRFVHYCIDLFIVQILMTVMAWGMQKLGMLTGEYDQPIFFLVSFVSMPSTLALYIAYFGGFELLFQKTPGKFITGCNVIDEYAKTPDFKYVLLRSLVRIVPFEPFSCFGDKHSYGWHDKWSRTWVVTDDELFQLEMLQYDQEQGIE